MACSTDGMAAERGTLVLALALMGCLTWLATVWLVCSALRGSAPQTVRVSLEAGVTERAPTAGGEGEDDFPPHGAAGERENRKDRK